MSCARRKLSNTRSKSDPPKAQSFGGSALFCAPAAAPAFFRICAGSSPRLGGLAGLNSRVTTVNCYAFGSVTANSASNHFGGFIGQAVGIHVNTAAGNFIPAFLPRKAVGLVFLAAGQYQNTNTRLRRARLGAAH